MGYELLTQNPFEVLISIYSQKTGLSPRFLETVYNTTKFNYLAYETVISKVSNQTQKEFVSEVYENLSEPSEIFAIKYISQQANISMYIVSEVYSLNSTDDYINFVSSIASNKSNLPQWFFISLLTSRNISNLTAYLILSHLSSLSELLQKSNLTTKELALLLQNYTDFRVLASELIVNYANFSPLLTVNKTELVNVLSNNVSIEQLIKENKFPIEPIQNITDNLYSSNLFLIFMKGNFTYQEAQDFQKFIQQILNVTTYLTGGEPISHQLKSLVAVACSIVIPVGIILAIILAGSYFRSFIAAFLPLIIYISAYLVASVFLWAVVIKLLNITVNLFTPVTSCTRGFNSK